MSIYDENKQIEGDENVLIAGKFSGPSSTQNNLVLVKGAGPEGWASDPVVQLPFAEVGSCGPWIWAGLWWWREPLRLREGQRHCCGPKRRLPSTPPLPRRAVTWLPRPPARRRRPNDLGCVRLRRGGRQPPKPLEVKHAGYHDAFWRAAADPPSWGLSVVANGALYLGAEAATTWPSSPKQTARSPG